MLKPTIALLLLGSVLRESGAIISTPLRSKQSADIERMKELFPMPPDNRHSKCKGIPYDRSNMPSVSVVIPYLKENLKLAQQTAASLIALTPPELLDEVLFVDDGNDDEWQFHQELTSVHPKVKVYRNEQRKGLIASKAIGAANTTSPVIVFMEPHCRANREWLEPLLVQLMASQDHKKIAIPSIDNIPEYDINSYSTWGGNPTGGYRYNLEFNWFNSATGYNRSYREPDPYPMPVLSGGLLAVWRDWFNEGGSYDQGMTQWGYENLEQSLRTWRCGGSIEVVPCSRVGHMFRRGRPYEFSGVNSRQNKNRLLDVWFEGKYKQQALKVEPGLDNPNYAGGDVSDRLALKERLGCKSMDWFVENIFPEGRITPGRTD